MGDHISREEAETRGWLTSYGGCLSTVEGDVVRDPEFGGTGEKRVEPLCVMTLGFVTPGGSQGVQPFLFLKDTVRSIRDGMTSWLEDGGHVHCNLKDVERMPSIVKPEEDDDEDVAVVDPQDAPCLLGDGDEDDDEDDDDE